jgi:hypothetical protein
MDYIWIFLIVYPIYGLIFYFLHNRTRSGVKEFKELQEEFAILKKEHADIRSVLSLRGIK